MENWVRTKMILIINYIFNLLVIPSLVESNWVHIPQYIKSSKTLQ